MQFTDPLRTLTKRVISRWAPTALLSSARPHSISDNLYCLGWDGRPLRGGASEGETGGQDKKEKDSETEDYRKYYENHKPSPLPEFVDARKPIIQVTDHADDGKEISLIRESVDDALRRAEETWWAAKVRGDPDSPQARALARMLRERYNGE